MTVSVVIPAWNEEKYIGPCIAALQAQTVPPDEVIVVSRSDDATDDMCRAAGWKVVRQNEPGIANARREGLAQATGDIILSTDADTQPESGWLAAALEAFIDEGTTCCYGPIALPSKKRMERLLTLLNTLFLWLNRVMGRHHLAGMNMGFRRDAYVHVGGYSSAMKTGEDVELGLRLQKIGRARYVENMKVVTSSRRIEGMGLLPFLWHNLRNYLRIYFTGKASSHFPPYR